MTDQAARLRALVEARLQGGEAAKGGPRLVAVASGKGGVGKTNLSLNLGLAMARRTGRSDVCLVDIDFGLANADVLCSVQPERTLADVLDGQCDMEDAMVLGPGACDCCLALAAGEAVPAWTSRIGAVWSNWREVWVRPRLWSCSTAAGIGRNVCAFTRSVDDLIIVTTPEPTALVDAYALVVAVADAPVVPRLHLVVNMAQDKAELAEVQERFLRTCDLFQGVTLEVHPGVPLDPVVRNAVRQRLPFMLFDPNSRAFEGGRSDRWTAFGAGEAHKTPLVVATVVVTQKSSDFSVCSLYSRSISSDGSECLKRHL